MAPQARLWHSGCGRLLPVHAFAFATSAQAGGLSFVGYDAPSGPHQGLREPDELAVSRDGLNVYTASASVNAIGVFTRNFGTGQLTFLERQYNDAGGVERLARVSGLAVSPDGGSVCATSRTDDSIVVFSRNAGTGALRFLEVQRDPYIDPPNTVLPPRQSGSGSALSVTVSTRAARESRSSPSTAAATAPSAPTSSVTMGT